MSGEVLRQRILKETEETIRKILEDADKKVNEILENARKTAERIKLRKKEETLKLMSEKERATLALARLEGKKKLLLVQENLFNKVINEVKNSLINMPRDDKYLKLLSKLIVDGIKKMKARDIIISVNRRDLAFIKSNFNEVINEVRKRIRRKVNISISDQCVDIIGGVIISSRDGAEIYNNSFDARLNYIIDNYRDNIVNVLFGEEK